MRVSSSTPRALSYLNDGERREWESWAKEYVRTLPDFNTPQGRKIAREIVRESRQQNQHSKNICGHGFVPEYILEEIAQNSPDPVARENAQETLRQTAAGEVTWKDVNELRAARDVFEEVYLEGKDVRSLNSKRGGWLEKVVEWLKGLFGKGKKQEPQEPGTSSRYVYDAQNSQSLRKVLKRKEGGEAVGDKDVDNAYDYAGKLLSFMKEHLGRNSLDNKGMNIHQTVHLGKNYNNAYWDGDEMAYGDGDGKIFTHFAQDPTVVYHELGHGIVQYHNKNGGLIYRGESGALNESFADINAVMKLHQDANIDMSKSTRDMWLIGAKTMLPYKDTKTGEMKYPALRSFLNEKAYENHPDIGTDRQPKHMKNKYTGSNDNGGVHINSGISNHAFYLAAHKIGGKIWETTYKIWYNALAEVPSNCTFKQWAFETVKQGILMAKSGTTAIKPMDVDHVVQAWMDVGVLGKSDEGQIQRLKDSLGHKVPKQAEAA